MPITADWNEADRLWTLTTGTEFTLAEVVALMDETNWGGASRFLWDLSILEQGPSETSEMRDMRRIIEDGQEKWAGGRIAVVVGREVDFGIGRIWQSFVESMGLQVKVFRERDPALSWVCRGSGGT